MWIYDCGNNFEIAFYYIDAIVKAARKLPNAKWDAYKKRWIVSKRYQNEVDAFYLRWHITSLAAAPEEIGEIPDMPELTVPCPINKTPFPFQSTGIAYILENERVLIGDQPGLGKTIQAIGANMITQAFPSLVICPATLKLNWRKEWMEVAGKKSVILDENPNTWRRYFQEGIADVAIVNYESLKTFFVAGIKKSPSGSFKVKDIIFNEHIDLFKTVIIDESHKCKDENAHQTKYTAGITRGKRYIYELSGTPIVNRTEDLIPQLHIIGRMKEFGGDELFKKRYCKQDNYLNELSYKLRKICFYQRKKKDVLTELPDKIRKVVLCDITTRKEYNAALGSLANYLKDYKSKTDDEVRKSMAGEAMVRIGVLRNISARGKINEVGEYVDELLAAGEKVVLFYHQREVGNEIHRKYPNAVRVSGDEDTNQRQHAVEQFQTNDNVKLILVSIQAGAEGITLTAASNVGLVEFPWNAAKSDQCEDRCHRISQKNAVQAAYFLGVNTVDQMMFDIIQEKRELAGTITGNEDDTLMEMVDRLAASLLKGTTMEMQLM